MAHDDTIKQNLISFVAGKVSKKICYQLLPSPSPQRKRQPPLRGLTSPEAQSCDSERDMISWLLFALR
jgi:hypothetical protein